MVYMSLEFELILAQLSFPLRLAIADLTNCQSHVCKIKGLLKARLLENGTP